MKRREFLIGTAGLLAATALPTVCFAGTSPAFPLGVIKGPTPIDQGMAIHEKDFTIYNGKIAVSFAVGSNNYWNMTSGSIRDVAVDVYKRQASGSARQPC